MHSELIHDFIEKMNNNSLVTRSIIAISKNVDYCEVYGNRVTESLTSWYKIFFIKNSNGKYVGAVNDMGSRELHWYVLPKHRKRGYLSKALEGSILEHLFKEREKQTINAEAKRSINVALRVGFTRDFEYTYTLEKTDFLNKKHAAKGFKES